MKLKRIALVVCSMFFSYGFAGNALAADEKDTLRFVTEKAVSVGHIDFARLAADMDVQNCILSFQTLDPRADSDLTNIRNKFKENDMIFENVINQLTTVMVSDSRGYSIVELNYPHEKIFSIFANEPGAENVLTKKNVDNLEYYYFIGQFCVHFIDERTAVVCSQAKYLAETVDMVKHSDFFNNEVLNAEYKKVAGKIAWYILNEKKIDLDTENQKGFASIDSNEMGKFEINFNFDFDRSSLKIFKSQYMTYSMLAKGFLSEKNNSEASRNFLKPLAVNFKGNSVEGSFDFKVKDLISISRDIKRINVMRKAMVPPPPPGMIEEDMKLMPK